MTFGFRTCDACGYSFLADPRVDFAALYNEEYYRGRGADTNVAYVEEMSDPRTVRLYEWDGILRAVTSLTGTPRVRWLDYGCGLGGLVRYLREHGIAEAYGFDEGWGADWMASQGLPLLRRDELGAYEGTFDVITAIEVIEHVTDPVGVMTHVNSLLKPGGWFFLTTGNAEPHLRRLLNWSYVNPDVHVGYFQPRTLATVYEKAGLDAEYRGFLPGHDDIIRYKVLKTLRLHRRNPIERLLPWRVLAKPVDWRHRVTAHPLGRKPVDPASSSDNRPS
jgi:SAM-dependent methyltransferase